MKYLSRLISAIILAFIGATSSASDGSLAVSPASITLNGITGTRVDQTLTIRNNSGLNLTVTIAESTLTPSIQGDFATSLPLDFQPFITKLRAGKLGHPITSPTNIDAAFEVAATDTRGDNLLFGVDVLSILYQKRSTFLGPVLDLQVRMLCPDNNVAGFLSLDVNQDFGSGIWPVPWQLGPPARDIGSEFEVLVDASGLIADSLGLGNNPIAVILKTTDTSFVYIPIIPTITRDSVLTITVSGIPFGGLGLNDPDQNLNIGAVFARLELTSAFPDYAPNTGHGIIGTEIGTSWIREDRTTVNILSGDSATIDVSVLAAKPVGTYNSHLRFSAPSQQPVDVPVQMNITGLGNPAISLSRQGINDSVTAGSSASVTLIISNNGDADLVWGIADTANTSWISTTPALGIVSPGMTNDAVIQLSSVGLATGSTYTSHLLIGSNDLQNGIISFPVSLTVLSPNSVGESGEVPTRYALHQNYPNPFNPTTTVIIDLPEATDVNLQIFDLLGRHLFTLVDGRLQPGQHTIPFDGITLPTGVYVCRMETPNISVSRKMLLLK
ncbi:MAG: T9SS type A sorting domain-containing protein [Bacteroidota bacterium]